MLDGDSPASLGKEAQIWQDLAQRAQSAMASCDYIDLNDALADLQEHATDYLLAIARAKAPTIDAEDVVAQAFMDLLPFISKNTPIRNVKALLAEITRRRATDVLRRHGRVTVESLDVATADGLEPTFLDSPEDPYESIDRVEEARAIANAIMDALSPTDREILDARHMEGLDVAETARKLNITQDQVKKRTQQAIASARRIVEAQELRHD